MSDVSENIIKRHEGDLRNNVDIPYVFDLKGVEVHVGTENEKEVWLAIRPPDYHGFPWIAYRIDRRDLIDLAKMILSGLDRD